MTLPEPPVFGAPIPPPDCPAFPSFLATRRSTSAVALSGPGPDALVLADLIRLAARVPDHGKLSPWRFIVLDGCAKGQFADRLEALATARNDPRAVAKLAKLRAPPVGIAVLSSVKASEIPEWEQILSAGCVCTTLLYAAQALGFGANWITDWYAYDREALAILGATEIERVAGFIFMGTASEWSMERDRPSPVALTTFWGRQQ